jgi:uncharacterized cupredoxin-like copper-binding protein
MRSALIALSIAVVLAAPASAGMRATTVNVTAGKPGEFTFTLQKPSVPRGTVLFKVTNAGNVPHNFEVCKSNKGGSANSCKGKVTRLISPGASATLTVVFVLKGTYEYLCTVTGHAIAGMKGHLKVT